VSEFNRLNLTFITGDWQTALQVVMVMKIRAWWQGWNLKVAVSHWSFF